MASAFHFNQPISTPEPGPMSPEDRAELERARWYNTSLDKALAELGRAERRIADTKKLLDAYRHFVGAEDEFVALLRNTLEGA